MGKTKEHIINHTKRLSANGKRIVNNSAKIANKNRHILLGYMHICLIIIGIYLFHMATFMYAQESGETIISQETMTIDNFLAQEEIENNETNINEDLMIENEETNNELIENNTIESESTGNIDEFTGEIELLTGSIESEFTGDIELLTGDIKSESTGGIELLTGDIKSESTGDIELLTGAIIENFSLSGDNKTDSGLDINEELILAEIKSPTDIEGLQAWLDASKTESITLSGNYIITRNDKRGYDSKAFSFEEEKRPILVQGVVNNHPAVYFDNIDNGMQTNIKLNSEYTLFIVYNKEHTAINFASAIGSNPNWFVGFEKNNFGFFATGLINTTSYRDGNIFKVVAVNANNSGTQVFLNNNNISKVNPTISPTQQLTLGNINTQKALGGYIAEIIVYESKLGDYEMTKIYEYFQRKYSPFTSKGLNLEKKKIDEKIIIEEIEKITEVKNDIKIENDIDETNSNSGSKIENNFLTGKIESNTNNNFDETKTNDEDIIIENKNEIIEEINSESKFLNAYKKDEENKTIGELQKFLVRYGTLKSEITNIYDSITIEAIYQFQIKENLLVGQENNKSIHGYFGPSTRTRVNELQSKFIEDLISKENNLEEEMNESTEENIIERFQEELLDKKEIFKKMLLSIGFKEEIKKGKKIMIGKKGFKLEKSQGIIPISTVINKDYGNLIGEITFPENTIIQTESGENFTGDISFFDIKNDEEIINGIEIIETFKAGADEPIFLKDENKNNINATIKIEVPMILGEEKIIVQYSHDGYTWNYLDTIETKAEENGAFATFQTNHFTIFSLGVRTGTFVINNDNELTTGSNVVLTTNINGASHMKFGNTQTERDNANRIVYNSNYPRNLTPINGEKTVYAMFSGNGTITYIQDSIFLDINTTTNGLQLHIDGSYNGNTFNDLSENNYIANGINNISKNILGGQEIMGFNGTNQYINIAQPIVSDYPFTISAWVKPDRINGTQGIVLRGRSNARNRYYGINLNNNRFQATARNTVSMSANGNIDAEIGKWSHVVGVFASSTSRTIYVNGVQGSTNTIIVSSDNNSQERNIGKYPGTTDNYFAGNIDEARVYNKILSNQEIQDLYITPPIFTPTTVYTSSPHLKGLTSDKTMNISLEINGNIYPANNNGNGTRAIQKLDPSLPNGIYDVTLNYENIYGAKKSTLYANGLNVQQLRNITYSPATITFGSVVASITGLSSDYFITNNNGSSDYTFTGNGNFDFQVQSKTGLQYTINTQVDRIAKGGISYNNINFYESNNNDGSIGNTIQIELSGDVFDSNCTNNGSIVFSEIPNGITPHYYLSGTQTLIIGLSGNAINHNSINNIYNAQLSFKDNAFVNYDSSDIANNTIEDIQIMFLDQGPSLHIDGSYNGNIFYDLSENNYIANGINNVSKNILGGQEIMGFNGSNQYINIAQPIVTNYPFTISAWVKPDRISGTQGIVLRGRSNARNRYYGINLNNNRFQITARNTNIRTANGTVNAEIGKWHHVVGVFASNGSRTIYVNGIQGNTSTNNVPLDNTSQQRTIGKYPGTSANYFAGNIDEVVLYNKVLSNQEIQNLYIKEPNFSNLIAYTTTPTLQGTTLDPNMEIQVIIDGNYYPATISGDVRKATITNPLLVGTYNVTLRYENIYGIVGEKSYTSSLTINNIRNIEYTPNSDTFDNVLATLVGLDENHSIINNNGSNQYNFTRDGNFIFRVGGLFGTIYEVSATVDRIKKGTITGTNLIFYEDEILNNGGIQNTISFQLSGDTFNNNATSNGSINISGLPSGLTANYYLNGTQELIIGLSGNAVNHANNNDTNNIVVNFGNGAFNNYEQSEIINSTITGIKIDFLNPYVGLQIYPSADTMIDADTDVGNGCGDGVCQERNFGSMDYFCASDFGSKILMKFDPSSIPLGSKITSTKLRLSRYYINTQTPGLSFSLRPINNNPGWIEGNKSNAKAGIGEVNYKMRKRTQEYWNNGNIGLVNGIDYGTTNMITNPNFAGAITSNTTQEFDFNGYGISMMQNRLDNPETNQGIMMGDSNEGSLCVRSKEYQTVGNRPMLTVTYAIDIDKPEITGLSPYNNETNVGLNNNLIITFNENIRKYTGYNIIIKRLHDNSIFKTIDAGSSNVIINNNIVRINHGLVFENFTGYYVEIQNGAFRDVAGNNFNGFIGSEKRNFTTLNTQLVPAIINNTASNITNNNAQVKANITSIGSDNITERGFYRSTTNGFNDNIGTRVSEIGNRDTLGDFSLNLTNLPSGTRIYFKGFATNSYGSNFTTQSGFLTPPTKPILKQATYIDNDGFIINRETTTGTSSYKLWVSTNSLFTTTIPGYNGKIIFDTKENLTQLQKETLYYYKIQAINDAGESETSNIQSAKTTWLPTPWSWLKLEEPSGSTTFDSSLNNNFGILLGGVLMNQTGVDGQAFQFDGVNDEVSIIDFDHGPDLTISFRIKTSNPGNSAYLYSHGDSSATNSINVLLNNSDRTIKTFINGQQTILNLNSSTYNTLTNNERHLYTLTIDDNGEVPGKKKATIYIDGTQRMSNSSVNAGTYDPINNITLGRRSANQANTFYKGLIDDVRIYNKTLNSGEVFNLFASFIDDTPPTAYIEYSSESGNCTNQDVIATLTGYSEPIVITNNEGLNTFTFTENGSFTFTFRDNGFNTGESVATVDWICKDPINIGGPTMINANIKATNDLQIVEQEFIDYFRVKDPIGTNNGYYTTIAVSDLSGQYQNISKNNIYMKSTEITLLSGTANSRVKINNSLNNYQNIGNPITYIKRDNENNYGIKGEYGNKPRLRFDIPAYVSIDEYRAILTYTLYEN